MTKFGVFPLFAVFAASILVFCGCAHRGGDALRNDSVPGAGTVETVMLPDGIPMDLVWIPGGSFLMGRAPLERDAHDDEAPQHGVTLTQGFWMGMREVTQAQWRAVMGTTPWAGKKYVVEGPDMPAVHVSWDDAQDFAKRLGELTGKAFRLPTEAEWERACRADTTTRFYWGDDAGISDIDENAWWKRNVLTTEEKHARPVGTKKANPWGLCDMAGNVFEWCADWYAPYPAGPVADPAGPETGKQKVVRGGSWMTIAGNGRSARRGHDAPGSAYEDLGFRLVASPPPVARDAGLGFVNVFTAGENGVDTYRIPAIVAAPDGSLLVFCEARKESIADASPTDMILRRSLDGGRTWLPVQTIARGTGSEALMNPCPVVDRETGMILLFFINANARGDNRNRHLLAQSADNGVTWSEAVDAEPLISGYLDTFVSGPCAGIQARSGRLIIPGYAGPFDEETKAGFRSRVLYSDDHGKSWTMGASLTEFTDESTAVELGDGKIMLNARGDMGTGCRAVALSGDGGATWSKLRWDPALNECPCQASLFRYDGSRILFANPDNTGEAFGVVERSKMTVRLSRDEGKTWPVKKLIHKGPSSYSGLVRLPDGDVGIIFEGGDKHRREWIRFARFSLAWLESGGE